MTVSPYPWESDGLGFLGWAAWHSVDKGAGEGTGWVEGPVPKTRPSCGHTWEEVPPSQEGPETSPGRRSQKAEGIQVSEITPLARAQAALLKPLSAFWETAQPPLDLREDVYDGTPRPRAMKSGNTNHERGEEPKRSWGQWWAREYPSIPSAQCPQNSSQWQCKPGFIGLTRSQLLLLLRDPEPRPS